MPKQKAIASEYSKINFPETIIAENNLNIQMLHKLNEYEKSFIPVAKKEVKTLQTFINELKVKISKANKQYKQLEELKKEIDTSNHCINKKIKSQARREK